MLLVEIKKKLKSYPLFENVEDYLLDRLALNARVVELTTRSNVSNLLDHRKYAYFTIGGVLGLKTTDPRDNQTILAFYREGEMADIGDLYSPRPEKYHILVARRAKFIVLDKLTLKWAMDQSRTLSDAFTLQLVAQARELMSWQASVGSLSLADQIKNYLIDASRIIDGRRVYVPEVDYSIICQRIGCTRATLCRTILYLTKKDLAVKEGKRLVLSDKLTHGTMITNIYGRNTILKKKKAS